MLNAFSAEQIVDWEISRCEAVFKINLAIFPPQHQLMPATLHKRQGLCSTSGNALFSRSNVLSLRHRCSRSWRYGSTRLQPCCSIKARWCIDIRYGVKLDAVALLQEWVMQIGSQAGLDLSKTQILSGAIGVPESRLVVSTAMPFKLFAVRSTAVPTLKIYKLVRLALI